MVSMLIEKYINRNVIEKDDNNYLMENFVKDMAIMAKLSVQMIKYITQLGQTNNPSSVAAIIEDLFNLVISSNLSNKKKEETLIEMGESITRNFKSKSVDMYNDLVQQLPQNIKKYLK